MRDRIIEGYLKSFVDEYGLGAMKESDAFERFVNHLVLSKHFTEPFDPDEVTVGGGGDLSLDGIGVLVNDNLVQSEDAVDYFKKHLRRLDAQFIFVQAKTSPKFDVAEIGSFISGVRQFFGKTLPATAAGTVTNVHRIKEHIFDSAVDMDKSPVCRLYYVTTGVWNDEPELRSRIDMGIKDLQDTGLFSHVEFTAVDAELLKRIHRELHHKIVREFVFEKHSILPTIGRVQEAYIGIVPATEYLKLLIGEDGLLNRRLFYDNVRDFQGHNAVNSEIEATITDNLRNDRFALLNNGVTIVARDANKVGATFRLRDYQIVNGCQTSHIIFLNRGRLTEKVYVPLKLIVTTDSEVTNQIVQGTNRQTEVHLEAFESLKPFQKRLEELYIALARDRAEPIYYERRSNQYDQVGVRREHVITLATQIKCFVAMFLNEPQSTHRYYGEVLASYRDRIFSDSHSLMPYFVSARALVVLEHLFAIGRLPREWRSLRYQLLMMVRIQNQTRDLPHLNSKDIENYCEELLTILGNETLAEAAARKAGELIEKVRSALPVGREPPERTRSFTTALIDAASNGRGTSSASVLRRRGRVISFSDVKGYGFIEIENAERLFVHYSGIQTSGFRSLRPGQEVEFAIISGTPSDCAVDVTVVDGTM